jgi:sulfide dehydrogenase cytochrome subunit
MSPKALPRLILITLSLALTCLATAAAPDLAAGCADCHGKDGVSTTVDVPTIAGISPFALEEQLGQYKAKERPCEKVKDKNGKQGDMCTIAGKLSDADITALAAHFGGLKFVPYKNTVDPAKAALGKKVHATNCEKCHSEGGSLADDDASILAGQPKGYLVLAMKELRAKQRPVDEKMAPKVKALSDAEVEALIEFFASGGKP